MKKRQLIFGFLFSLSLTLFAQSPVRADELFVDKQYLQAKEQYQNLLSVYPQNQLYQYRYARCLQETGMAEEAIRWFERAGEKYALRNFYLGVLYAQTYRFEQAILALEKYMATIDDTHDRYHECEQWIDYAKKGQKYLKRVEDIIIIDSLKLNKKNLLSVYELSEESGKLSKDSVGFIFVNARGDRMVREVKSANTENPEYRLVTSERLLTEWTEYDTLPEPINVGANIRYPFMMSDGMTLYYASDSEDGLGGYDIYVTRYNPSTGVWLTPENIGFPFNSNANDYLYVVDEQRRVGMFATDRFTSANDVMVYLFALNESKRLLRDTTEDYIRMAAQLLISKSLDLTDFPQKSTAVTDSDKQERQQPLFVINDSTVYNSWLEFSNEQTQNLAKQYIELTKRIQKETISLQEQRQKYRISDDTEQRNRLTSVILRQEKTLRNMNEERKSLLKQLRLLETEALAQP